MNEKVLNGIRRVKKCLLLFCWIFFGVLILSLIGKLCGDKELPNSTNLLNLAFFVFSFVFYTVVSSFLNGYDGKED